MDQFQLNFTFISSILEKPFDEYIEFNSAIELLDAFQAGKVQDIIITRHIYNAFFSSLKDNLVRDLGFSYALPLSFSNTFPKENIDIVNKLLSQVSQTMIEDFAVRNVALITQRSTAYYLKQYWYILALGVLFLGSLVLMVIYKMRKQKEYEVKHASEVNPLTNCYTFSKFLSEARTYIKMHPDEDLRFVFFDIDNFSFINEAYGFDVGSKVLQHIAQHIRKYYPDISTLAHYDGDTFALICKKMSETSEELIQKAHLNDLQASLGSMLGIQERVNLSIGIYDIMDKELDTAYMIDCAQIACNKSKEVFGTHVSFYTKEMKQENLVQNKMLNLIRRALEENEFELFYQPKFDIDHMHVVGAEALIRWFKDGKMIPPDMFIPIAEKHGLINELDYHVIELACRFISKYRQACLPHLSINISGFTIIKNEVIDKLIEITETYDVSPHEIDIEITETALVNNFDMAIKQILALRELGFTISMDDFGTGVSSLNRLSQMPLDTIKLDRVFIINALENKKSSVIVRMVIELAKNINAKTVAEGIETQEQLNLLKSFSCEHGQGYFYARPMSEQGFIEYLTEKGCNVPQKR